mmetsp:Transcript_95073/g.251182  ORF Transcript_95073/g.251182 Transcript_95073/m.251182 type:complete len:257 (-) Transcript_95073:94-864(-)
MWASARETRRAGWFWSPLGDCASPLLHLGPAHGGVNALVHEVPVHLLEHGVHVRALGNQQRALAVRHGGVQLHRQATRAHVRGQPDPALSIVDHLLRLVLPGAALDDVLAQLHLLLQARNADGDVPLADPPRGRALPLAAVAGERAPLVPHPVEVLDDELRRDRALRGVAAVARDRLVVERLDVGIADVVLSAAARGPGHLPPHGGPRGGRARRGRGRHEGARQEVEPERDGQAGWQRGAAEGSHGSTRPGERRRA